MPSTPVLAQSVQIDSARAVTLMVLVLNVMVIFSSTISMENTVVKTMYAMKILDHNLILTTELPLLEPASFNVLNVTQAVSTVTNSSVSNVETTTRWTRPETVSRGTTPMELPLAD